MAQTVLLTGLQDAKVAGEDIEGTFGNAGPNS